MYTDHFGLLFWRSHFGAALVAFQHYSKFVEKKFFFKEIRFQGYIV